MVDHTCEAFVTSLLKQPIIRPGEATLARKLPDKPGVYAVCELASGKPFYFGETASLSRRIKTLFSDYCEGNPHPCHKHIRERLALLIESSLAANSALK